MLVWKLLQWILILLILSLEFIIRRSKTTEFVIAFIYHLPKVRRIYLNIVGGHCQGQHGTKLLFSSILVQITPEDDLKRKSL